MLSRIRHISLYPKINKNLLNSELYLQKCQKIEIRQKSRDKFCSNNRFLNRKIINYFDKI